MTAGLLDFLYTSHTNSLFPQDPPIQFEHGIPKKVAFLPVCPPSGYNATIYETRIPASFFEAEVIAPDGTLYAIKTGSGSTSGLLLKDFCEALQKGGAKLSLKAAMNPEGPMQAPEPGSDGRAVHLHATDSGTVVYLPEAYLDDNLKHPVTVTFMGKDNQALAQRLALCVVEGMIDIE